MVVFELPVSLDIERTETPSTSKFAIIFRLQIGSILIKSPFQYADHSEHSFTMQRYLR